MATVFMALALMAAGRVHAATHRSLACTITGTASGDYVQGTNGKSFGEG